MVKAAIVYFSGSGHTKKMAEAVLAGEDRTNRLGFFFGAGGQALMESPEEAPNAEDRKTGELLGRRVAAIAQKFKS